MEQMFCTQCGKKIDVTASVCPYCGTKIQGAFPLYSAQKPAFSLMPFLKKNLKLAIGILALFVLIVLMTGGYFIAAHLCSPQRLAEQYVKELMAEQWESAYEKIDFENSEWISEETFQTYMEEHNDIYSKIKNFEVEEFETPSSSKTGINELMNGLDSSLQSGQIQSDETASGGLTKLYRVSYVQNGSSSNQYLYLTLVKQNKNQYLFFPSYKISGGEMHTDFTIYTLEDAEVYLDNIKVEQSNEASQEQYSWDGQEQTAYNIPAVFYGTHQLKITHPLADDYEEELTINSTNSTKEYSLYSMDYREEVTEELESQAQEYVTILCNSAINGTDFDDLELEITSDKDWRNRFEEVYENIVSKVHIKDGIGLKSIDITEFESISKDNTLNSSMQYTCKINIEYNYVELEHETYSSLSPIIESASERPVEGYMYLVFSYEAGEWCICGIDSWKLNY